MANTQILILVLAAMVAGLFAIRLYTVLGRRTGNEREPSEPLQRQAGAIAAPKIAAVPVPAVAGPADPALRGLVDIQLADRGFDKERFIAGARQAYEIVVTAFARNDRIALRPLLSDDVYAVFDGAMKGREERGEKTAFAFTGFKDSKLTAAELKDDVADITVQFAAQFISSTTDASGAVIAGDVTAVRDVVDRWTFSRTLRKADPNWTLVATAGPEAL
ncbi:MAG TPA: Tim44/TimA family putative adaptor protein [Rhizomicrobium sp.]|nr:Tim44/TimA family putative adaptor protein [Rhizomicrobium sp.]